MILKNLKIENLRSYEHQEITFPKGSTLLSGDIGSGKTTILLAIEFALFGLQPSQKGSSLLRNGEDNGKVTLEFEIENQNIIIERTLKRTSKSISQDYASLTIDNEKTEASVTEIKNKILKILNYPSEFAKKTNLLYKFTVYTPQEEMKQIILESGDLRLNTLRHVFGINKYKKIQENTTILTSKLREKIRINQALISELDNDKELLEKKKLENIELKSKQITIQTEHEDSIKLRELKETSLKEIEEKINEKRNLENEKSKSSILFNEKNQQISNQITTLSSLKQQIQEASTIQFSKEEYNLLDERIQFQQNKEDEIQKQYLEVITKINTLNSKIQEAEHLKTKISHLNNCPTCLQNVSEEYKNNILTNANNEITKSQESIKTLSIQKNKFSETIEQTKKAKEDYKKRKSELELLKIKLEALTEKQQRITEIERQKQILEKDTQMLKKHIQTLDESIQSYQKYDSIYQERNKELQEAKLKENQIAIKKAETNKDIQFTEIQIQDIIKQIDKKENIKSQIDSLQKLEYWISNKFLEIILFTEKQVMITLKQEFSRLFSQWFSTLVSDSLSATLDDEFAPLIMQQDYELDYSFLSGGERTAIALAYRLSLNQVINSLMSNLKTSNLVILDEPTDGFSSPQLDKMRDVLGQLETEQLIIVSHEQKIEGFVDNIIRIKKDGNKSGVEG